MLRTFYCTGTRFLWSQTSFGPANFNRFVDDRSHDSGMLRRQYCGSPDAQPGAEHDADDAAPLVIREEDMYANQIAQMRAQFPETSEVRTRPYMPVLHPALHASAPPGHTCQCSTWPYMPVLHLALHASAPPGQTYQCSTWLYMPVLLYLCHCDR
jgi:hypothetical protein